MYELLKDLFLAHFVYLLSSKNIGFDKHHYVFILFGATALSGPGPPQSRGFWITLKDTPQSVELLWTSDKLVTEPST